MKFDRKLMRFALAMAAGATTLASTKIAHAQTPSTPASTQSLTDLVMAKARRLHEFLDILKNKDPAVQMAAMQFALKDSDPLLRSMAISAYLKRFNALTPEVVQDEHTQTAPEDIPRLAMFNIAWSEDGMSFTGNYATTCSFGVAVRGQIAGGKLAITYDGVCLRPAVLGIDSGGDDKKAAQANVVACELTLTPNSEDNSLDGPLHCNGMKTNLPARLPFGS